MLLCVTLFASCGSTPPSDDSDEKEDGTPNDVAITGITFTSNTFVYDGTEKSLAITGTLPSGVTVSYSGNVGTNAGTYNATATMSGTGYTTLTLNATLTISKATIDPSTLTFAENLMK